MNRDIRELIMQNMQPPDKDKAIKQEVFVKQQVTKRPFNLRLIKNQRSFALDIQTPDQTGSEGLGTNRDNNRSQDPDLKKKKQKRVTLEDDTPKKQQRKVNDDMQAFTHFLLGKTNLDASEKEEMMKQQNDRELMKLLEQKEQMAKKGNNQSLFAGGSASKEDTKHLLEKIKHKLNNSNFTGAIHHDNQSLASSNRSGRKSTHREYGVDSQLTPIKTESGEGSYHYVETSSEEDPTAKVNYKNSAYWALPENVRQAIDTAKRKSKHSDFYIRLKSLNEKIGVYKKLFYAKQPRFEKMFMDRKKKRLEALMRREQQELENFMIRESKKTTAPHQSNKKSHHSHPQQNPSGHLTTALRMPPQNFTRQVTVRNSSQVVKIVPKNFQAIKETEIQKSSDSLSSRSHISNETPRNKKKEQHLAPAGKMRRNLKDTRRFQSSIEIQLGTNLRKAKMDIKDNDQDMEKQEQIEKLKTPHSKNTPKGKQEKSNYLSPNKKKGGTNYSNLASLQHSSFRSSKKKNGLSQVPEEQMAGFEIDSNASNMNQSDTSDMSDDELFGMNINGGASIEVQDVDGKEIPNFENDSIDQEIRKDIQIYRKEKMEAKNIRKGRRPSKVVKKSRDASNVSENSIKPKTSQLESSPSSPGLKKNDKNNFSDLTLNKSRITMSHKSIGNNNPAHTSQFAVENDYGAAPVGKGKMGLKSSIDRSVLHQQPSRIRAQKLYAQSVPPNQGSQSSRKELADLPKKKKKSHYKKRITKIFADIHSSINEINKGGTILPNFGHYSSSKRHKGISPQQLQKHNVQTINHEQALRSLEKIHHSTYKNDNKEKAKKSRRKIIDSSTIALKQAIGGGLQDSSEERSPRENPPSGLDIRVGQSVLSGMSPQSTVMPAGATKKSMSSQLNATLTSPTSMPNNNNDSAFKKHMAEYYKKRETQNSNLTHQASDPYDSQEDYPYHFQPHEIVAQKIPPSDTKHSRSLKPMFGGLDSSRKDANYTHMSPTSKNTLLPKKLVDKKHKAKQKKREFINDQTERILNMIHSLNGGIRSTNHSKEGSDRAKAQRKVSGGPDSLGNYSIGFRNTNNQIYNTQNYNTQKSPQKQAKEAEQFMDYHQFKPNQSIMKLIKQNDRPGNKSLVDKSLNPVDQSIEVPRHEVVHQNYYQTQPGSINFEEGIPHKQIGSQEFEFNIDGSTGGNVGAPGQGLDSSKIIDGTGRAETHNRSEIQISEDDDIPHNDEAMHQDGAASSNFDNLVQNQSSEVNLNAQPFLEDQVPQILQSNEYADLKKYQAGHRTTDSKIEDQQKVFPPMSQKFLNNFNDDISAHKSEIGNKDDRIFEGRFENDPLNKTAEEEIVTSLRMKKDSLHQMTKRKQKSPRRNMYESQKDTSTKFKSSNVDYVADLYKIQKPQPTLNALRKKKFSNGPSSHSTVTNRNTMNQISQFGGGTRLRYGGGSINTTEGSPTDQKASRVFEDSSVKKAKIRKKVIGGQGGDNLLFENLIMSRHPTQESGKKAPGHHMKHKSEVPLERRKQNASKQSHFDQMLQNNKKANLPTLSNGTSSQKPVKIVKKQPSTTKMGGNPSQKSLESLQMMGMQLPQFSSNNLNLISRRYPNQINNSHLGVQVLNPPEQNFFMSTNTRPIDKKKHTRNITSDIETSRTQIQAIGMNPLQESSKGFKKQRTSKKQSPTTGGSPPSYMQQPFLQSPKVGLSLYNLNPSNLTKMSTHSSKKNSHRVKLPTLPPVPPAASAAPGGSSSGVLAGVRSRKQGGGGARSYI